MASFVVSWLERQGWEVYKEVLCPHHRRVVDIYAVRGRESWAIEAKMSLNLRLLEQAQYWVQFANSVSIVVPSTKKHRRLLRFVLQLCNMLGIGLLVVKKDGTVVERLRPRMHRISRRPVLVEAQKHSTAGTNRRDHWTPLVDTIKNLQEYVHKNPGCSVVEACTSIPHHYKNNSSAINSLMKLIRAGKVEGVRLRYSFGVPVLEPVVA
ncbi:MAG: hypothetical protein D6800_06665 [Candidatus Zixiibacteriota bacterium]|nr:MAG: hypothetical protein D6800_06665 [candidate division Zixibacteria bacterium]